MYLPPTLLAGSRGSVHSCCRAARSVAGTSKSSAEQMSLSIAGRAQPSQAWKSQIWTSWQKSPSVSGYGAWEMCSLPSSFTVHELIDSFILSTYPPGKIQFQSEGGKSHHIHGRQIVKLKENRMLS